MTHLVVNCVGNSSLEWGKKDLRETAVYSQALTRNHITYSTGIRALHLMSLKITLVWEPTATFSIHFLFTESRTYSFCAPFYEF